jgi:hypothetical protein
MRRSIPNRQSFVLFDDSRLDFNTDLIDRRTAGKLEAKVHGRKEIPFVFSSSVCLKYARIT